MLEYLKCATLAVLIFAVVAMADHETSHIHPGDIKGEKVTLQLPPISPGFCSYIDVPVSNAADGDVVELGVQARAYVAGVFYIGGTLAGPTRSLWQAAGWSKDSIQTTQPRWPFRRRRSSRSPCDRTEDG